MASKERTNLLRYKEQNKKQYTDLSKVKSGTQVDVYGVVKFVKPPFKSRGSDYCITFSITDSSFDQPDHKLKCNIFGKDESSLPLVKVGDIIRFHRLRVSSYQGDLQAISSPGMSWLIFSGCKDAPVEPRTASSNNYTFTDGDKTIVTKLREWITTEEELCEKFTKFEDVAAGCYFNLICQVVVTAIVEPGVCVLLRVWDGTQCLNEARKEDDNTITEKLESPDLVTKSRDLTHDVFIFDDHYQKARKIEPGDYVKFYNLHAAKWTPPQNNTIQRPGISPIELVLHRGNSYGRSMVKIPPDSQTLRPLKKCLSKAQRYSSSEDSADDAEVNVLMSSNHSSNEIVISSETPDDVNTDGGKTKDKLSDNGKCDQQRPSTSTEGKENRPTSTKRVIDSQQPSTSGVNKQRKSDNKTGKNKTDSGNGNADVTEGETESQDKELSASAVPRCMLQTATITLNHPHIQHTRIKDVLHHKVPYKFRIRAKIVDYHPKPSSVATFLQLYCSNCHYLCPHPQKNSNRKDQSESSQLRKGSTFNGVVHYNCPQCYANKESLTDLESPPHLQFIYMMRVLLKDDSGMLMANIWRADAEVFFQNIAADKLVRDPNSITHISELLNQICPENVEKENKPWIECCVRSFCTADGTGFQIFDTTIV